MGLICGCVAACLMNMRWRGRAEISSIRLSLVRCWAISESRFRGRGLEITLTNYHVFKWLHCVIHLSGHCFCTALTKSIVWGINLGNFLTSSSKSLYKWQQQQFRIHNEKNTLCSRGNLPALDGVVIATRDVVSKESSVESDRWSSTYTTLNWLEHIDHKVTDWSGRGGNYTRERERERERNWTMISWFTIIIKYCLSNSTNLLPVVLSTWKWGKHLALHLYRNISKAMNIP